MKQFIRSITLVLLVGGWALASAAVHVIRVPGHSMPMIITKDQLGYTDEYVDTRTWSLNDISNHKVVVQRLLELRQGGVLSHAVNSGGLSTEAQLVSAIGVPNATQQNAGLSKAVAEAVKARTN